jgi:hypothetical protein
MLRISSSTTADALANALSFDIEDARILLACIRGELNPADLPAGAARVRQCYHRPNDADITMSVADAVLDTFGVEGWVNPSNYTEGVSYCNTGDSYDATLILGPDGEFYVGGWADAHELWPAEDGESMDYVDWDDADTDNIPDL